MENKLEAGNELTSKSKKTEFEFLISNIGVYMASIKKD